MLGMRKSELLDYANEQGLEVSSSMTKAQIVETIEESEAEA